MKKNRLTLKEYFKKGAIPTESNFGDLIDSVLNQDEDNIQKEPNKPLRITATGADEALLDFYRKEGSEEKFTWQIKQKPAGKAGLSFGDETASRLFIQSGTGNVGIGTTDPTAKFQVAGGAIMPSAGNNESSGLLFPRDPGGGGGDRAWMRYFPRNAGEAMTLSIGIENDSDDHIALMPSGNVGIGTIDPKAKLEVNGELKVTALINAGNSDLYFTKADHNHTGTGNNESCAAIENAKDYNALMILGRSNYKDGKLHQRIVRLWDYLEVNGELRVTGNLYETLEIIRCQNRGDWTSQNHPIMNYFRSKLSGKPKGTMLRAIQDHPDWRGHYWQGWVDEDGKTRVIHNNIKTTTIVN